MTGFCVADLFLSIQAQDFIEEKLIEMLAVSRFKFLSIQAQDFIEERCCECRQSGSRIPEHSSSGLH